MEYFQFMCCLFLYVFSENLFLNGRQWKKKEDAFWHLFTGVMTSTNRDSFEDNQPKLDSLAQTNSNVCTEQ